MTGRTTEHFLIGAAFLSPAARTVVAELGPNEINDPDLAEIVAVIRDLTERDQPADVPSVARALAASGSTLTLDDIQGLADLTDRLGNPDLAVHYRDILRDQNREADRSQFFTELADKVRQDPGYDAQPDLDAFLRQERARDDGGGRMLAAVIDELLADAQTRIGGVQPNTTLPLGLPSLDRQLRGGGLHPGELVIVGGRPGSGKSLFAGQVAMNVARRGGRVLFVSAEMTAVALARRMALEHTGLPAWVFDATGAVEARWETARTEAVQRIATEVRNLPIYIHDASRPTTAAMRQAFHRHGPFDLVLFDYTSLSGDAVRSDSEERRMAEIALNLQQFARDCAVPVIALHQLSRAVEHASPFRPAMAHLRDSGQVEANAHVVLLLYRRQYYVDQGRMDPDPALEHVLEINVAKNRDGETGIVPLHFDGTTSRIREQRRI